MAQSSKVDAIQTMKAYTADWGPSLISSILTYIS